MPLGRASKASPFSALSLLILLLCSPGAVAKKEDDVPLTVSPSFAPAATVAAVVTTAPVDAVDIAPVDTAPVDTAPVDTAPADTAPVDSAPADTAWNTSGGPQRKVHLTDFYVELTSVSNDGCELGGAMPLSVNAFLTVTKAFLEDHFAESLVGDGYGYEALFLVFTGYGPSHRGCRRFLRESPVGGPRRRGQEVKTLSKYAIRFQCMAMFRDGFVPPVSHLDDLRRTALDLESYLVAINDPARGVITSDHNIIEVQSNNAEVNNLPTVTEAPVASGGGAAMKAAVAGALLAMGVGAVLLLIGLRRETLCLKYGTPPTLTKNSTAEDSFDRDRSSNGSSNGDFEARSVMSYDANSIMGGSVGASMAGYSVAGQSIAGSHMSSRKGHRRVRSGGGLTLSSLVDDRSEGTLDTPSPGGRSRAESAEFHVTSDRDGQFDEIWGSDDEHEGGTEVVRFAPPARQNTHDTLDTLPKLGRTNTSYSEDEPFDQRRQRHNLTRQQLTRQQSKSSQFSQPFDERR